MTTWDPAQYLRFADDRERPFWDLVARIAATAPRAVVDLGCGPGTATVGLVDRWPGATVTGLDSSPEMIEQARSLDHPGQVHFDLADVTTWAPEPASLDVILSNATLQWVPGHQALFPAWLAALRPGGVLAFQVPGNFSAPTHTLLHELAASPRWRDRLGGIGVRLAVPGAEEYLRGLQALGGLHVDAWETTYLHTLRGPDPIVEWVRGTALRPYLSALGEDEADEFIAEYRAAVRLAYPPEPSGETLLPFRRIFVVATLTDHG